jgi:ATPase subunit of ABC transporter with duplicated ATPase domains
VREHVGQPISPALPILNEPTNYLNLNSMEALESAHAAYDGALFVVSHDEALRARLFAGSTDCSQQTVARATATVS